MDLNESRREINEIDDQIVRLFLRRMDAVVEVARYKQQTGLPVLDAGREEKVLDRVASLAGEDMSDYVRQLYTCLMALSRDYQVKLLGREDDAT